MDEAISNTPPRSADKRSERGWKAASFLVLAIGAVARVYALELKPLHHDEGVNGVFLARLFNQGAYQYDPTNYHGPTLYYLSLVTTSLFGLSAFSIRLTTALFGIGTIWLVLALRKYLGSTGSLAAASLLAVSPGAVYLSRYFIHESLFLFFTLGLVVAALYFLETKRVAYLALAASAAALLFATKETAFISVGVLGLAFLFVRLCAAWRRRGESIRAREPERPVFYALVSVLVFATVFVLFYSSLFTHFQGVADAFKSFEFWARTGSEQHVRPWYRYLEWLFTEEAPLVVLAATGAAVAIFKAAIYKAADKAANGETAGRKRSDRFALFAALWLTGIITAYSLVPYKTSWLMLNFIIPLAINAGYAVNKIYERSAKLAALVLIFSASLSASRMVSLNFFRYDDAAYAYVYAHTGREMLGLVKEIERQAARQATGRETTVAVMSPDYWPLPWYLRDYKRVGYYGRVVATDDALVIGSAEQGPGLETSLANRYEMVADYPLRPGVTLVLYARKDLYKP